MTVRELIRELTTCESFDAPITVEDIHGNKFEIDFVVGSSEWATIALAFTEKDIDIAIADEDTEENDYDYDWGYNEDMGYDPYMGCYTDDC